MGAGQQDKESKLDMERSSQDLVEAPGGYAAAYDGAALFERDDRVLLRLTGRDPVRMVQGLISNDLAGAPEGQAVYAAMLTPKGRMIADLRALRLPDGGVLLDVDRAAAEAVEQHLRKSVPPLFARAEVLETAGLSVHGPQARNALSRALADGAWAPEVPPAGSAEDTFSLGEDGAVLVVSTRQLGVDGWLLLATGPAAATRRADARAGLMDAGAAPATAEAMETLRVEAGRPRWGAELGEERIPLEAGLLDRAISTSKGCYTGQEVIIRILHRGHVNWQLRGLVTAGLGYDLPAGAELTRTGEEKIVGRVTSAVRSPRYGGRVIGLGYVRREVEPGSELTLGEQSVRTVELPFAEELP